MLHALDNSDGKPVDWWFMYKLPIDVGPSGKKTKGTEYLYYDSADSKPLRLSPHTLADAAGAVYHTMQQLWNDPSETTGWIFYNDEYPPVMHDSDWASAIKPKLNRSGPRKGRPENNEHNGHCKGVIAFDHATDTAFWLSHSTPCVPALYEQNGNQATAFYFPDYAVKYAQTYICMTLDSCATASKIAKVMLTQHQPQVYSCHIPDGVAKGDALYKLSQGVNPPAYSAQWAAEHGHRVPVDLTFNSKAGKPFRLLAKSGAWYNDFWIDLVGPTLGCDLRVETWRRLTETAILPVEQDAKGQNEFGADDRTNEHDGKVFHHEFEDEDEKHVVDEVATVDLGRLTDSNGDPLTNYTWSYTKDHAKWGIGEPLKDRGNQRFDGSDTQGNWICIADINRMSSQEKRGGGAICFHEPLLWEGLNVIEGLKGDIT